jgi:hypothetical protein
MKTKTLQSIGKQLGKRLGKRLLVLSRASARIPSHGRLACGSLSRGAMLTDVLLVLVWGASIPGLMWLGAAGGF